MCITKCNQSINYLNLLFDPIFNALLPIAFDSITIVRMLFYWNPILGVAQHGSHMLQSCAEKSMIELLMSTQINF